MDWNKFGIILIAAFMIWRIYSLHKSGGLKALFEKSRNAEQHWQTFAIIMSAVVLFVILLIKL